MFHIISVLKSRFFHSISQNANLSGGSLFSMNAMNGGFDLWVWTFDLNQRQPQEHTVVKVHFVFKNSILMNLNFRAKTDLWLFLEFHIVRIIWIFTPKIYISLLTIYHHNQKMLDFDQIWRKNCFLSFLCCKSTILK